MLNRVGFPALLACLLAVSGCGQSRPAVGNADSTSTLRDRLLFQTSVTERLAATRAQLDSLKVELPHATAEMGAAVQHRAATLSADRDSVAARAAELSAATDEEWQRMKLKTADLLDSLEHRIASLREELRESGRHGSSRR